MDDLGVERPSVLLGPVGEPVVEVFGQAESDSRCGFHATMVTPPWWYSGVIVTPLGGRTMANEDPCLVEGCERSPEKRGWCNRHYKRWRRWGDPLGSFQPKPVEERFWAKVNKNGAMPAQGIAPGACWEWTGAITSWGYGQFRPDYPDYKVCSVVHRYSYELHVGPIPNGFQVDHLCRNRKCVNPSHLEAVTQLENIRRGFSQATINRLRTHCPKRHPYSAANTYIAPKGGRYCRECARQRSRFAHQKRKSA